MREFFIWNVRLQRNYAYQTRLLTRTDNIEEALPYAEAWCRETRKSESDDALIISTLECEGSLLVPDGLDLTQVSE